LLEHPDQGTIWFQGRALSSHGDWFNARKRITLVDQNPYAFHDTVFANVAYGLRLRKAAAGEVEKRVAAELALVGLTGFETRRARTLSGGEVQRMAMARALVCDPAVLLLDEPTAHVDEEREREVERVILSLKAQKNMSIILATHDQAQAGRMADRLLRLENGRLAAEGARIVEGRLTRQNGKLILASRSDPGEDGDHGPAADLSPDSPETVLLALELAGESVLLRFKPPWPLVRASREEIESARPIPGEPVRWAAPNGDSKA